MKLELEFFENICHCKTFNINNKIADEDDFGEPEDEEPELAEDYACGYRKFIPHLANQKVLDKYEISIDEYNIICKKLEEELSWGACGNCV